MTAGAFGLHAIAPRLARARDAFLASQREHARRERRRLAGLERAEQIVIHRELQLLRAGATGDRRYVARRQHKLDQARALVARLSTPTPYDQGARAARNHVRGGPR